VALRYADFASGPVLQSDVVIRNSCKVWQSCTLCSWQRRYGRVTGLYRLLASVRQLGSMLTSNQCRNLSFLSDMHL
jgi:hypothetical protein